jgi:hypothetical protein
VKRKKQIKNGLERKKKLLINDDYDVLPNLAKKRFITGNQMCH